MTTNSEAVAYDILGKRGLTLSEAGKFAVLGWLDSNLQVRHDSAGKLNVTVVNDDGNEIQPEAFFADWAARHPGYFASAPKTEAQPVTPADTKMSMTDRMVSDLREMRSADRKAERAAEIATQGNPWRASTKSMTRQAQITNFDPALAAKLKAEAGSV